MAEIVTLKSDLSGTVHDSEDNPVEPHRYEWEGQRLRIDLTDAEYDRWKVLMAPYLEASRVEEPPSGTTRRRNSPNGRSRSDPPSDGMKAKAWAAQLGAEVNERGPCPDDVMAAWKADDPRMIADRIPGGLGDQAEGDAEG